MNYYNPYYIPYGMASRNLFSNLFGRISLSSILNGTQKTLNIVNQAIPVVKQITPMFKNAKTMFRIVNEFSKNDTSINNTNNQNIYEKESQYTNVPTFFK